MHLELLILGLKDTEGRDMINSFDSPLTFPADPVGIKFTLQEGAPRVPCATVCASLPHIHPDARLTEKSVSLL